MFKSLEMRVRLKLNVKLMVGWAGRHSIRCILTLSTSKVHTGQGKLEKVREFEWSGKVRENAKVTGKSGKFWGKIFTFLYSCCNANNSRAGVQSTILLAVVIWLLYFKVTYLLKSCLELKIIQLSPHHSFSPQVCSTSLGGKRSCN